MTNENAFEFEMSNLPEANSTSNDSMITSSDQLLLDTFIQDLINNKKMIDSTMESVMRLMRDVECEEKCAEQANEEADQSSSSILVKMEERKQALRQAEEIHDTLVRKVYVQKAVLATKQVVLQHRVARMLDDGDRSLEVLIEMYRSLEMRLTSALMKKDLAIKRKLNNEVLSQKVLAYEDFRLEKILEESKRWKQESLEISEFMEFLIERAQVVDMLQGDIYNENLSTLRVSSSTLRSDKWEGNKNRPFVADSKNELVVSAITEEGHSKNKLRESQMFDEESIKNVKIKNKRHGNQKFVKRIKRVKIKRVHVVLKRCEAAYHRENSSDDIQESMEAANMTDGNVFEFEIVNDEDDFMLNMIGRNCSTQLLETSIQDAKNKKKTLDSAMDSVKNLMKQVEYEEKVAEEAKQDAALTCSDIMAKVDASKKALIHAEETTNKLAKKVSTEKDALATKIEAFQLRVAQMVDDGEKSIALLEEMHQTLEMRLSSALMQKDIANKKKQVRDEYVTLTLVDQEIHRGKAVEEFKRLEQEELEISKLQEVLVDRGNVVDMLHGEISDKCLHVLLLKDEFDQAILSSGIFSSKRPLANDLNSSSLEKVEENENVVFEAETKTPHVVDDIREDEQEMLIEDSGALRSTIKSLENKSEVFKADITIPLVVEEKQAVLIEDSVALQSTIRSAESKSEIVDSDIKIPLVVEEIIEEKQAMLIEDSEALQLTIKSPENKNKVFEADIKIPLVVEEVTEEKLAMLIEDSVALQSTIKSPENKNEVFVADTKVPLVVEEIPEEKHAMLLEDWVVLQSAIKSPENENDVLETDIKNSPVVEDVIQQTMLIEDSVSLQSTNKSLGYKNEIFAADIKVPLVVKDVMKKKQVMLSEGSGILQSIMKNTHFRENRRDVGTKEADIKAPLVVKDGFKNKQAMLSEGSGILQSTMKNKYFTENRRDVGTKESSGVLQSTMKNTYFTENRRHVGTKEVNKQHDDQMPAKNVKSTDANQNNDSADGLVFCIILFMIIVLWFFNIFPKTGK